MHPFRNAALTVVAMVFPGLAQLLTRRYRAAVVLGIPYVMLVTYVIASVGGAGFIGTALDPRLVMRIGWVLAVLGALAAVSVTHTAIHLWDRPQRRAQQAHGMARVALCSLVPLVAGTFGLSYADRHTTTIKSVFVGGATRALPSPLADDNVELGRPPTLGVPEEVANESGRWNILLLGGDGGKYRSGVRTDSMMLVSVDRATGDTAIVSVPRNLERLPLPEGPLRKLYPRGWSDIANSLYYFLERRPDLTDGTATGAGAVMKGAFADALGQPIDNFVFVNMGGFIDIVDALGGVTLNIGTAVPSPGNPAEAKHPVRAVFSPGVQHLDGTDALAYSRSRSGDSDYKRMARQRCLLAAAARQINPLELVRNYDSLLNALSKSILSDLSPSEARKALALFQRVDAESIRSLGLAPPLISVGSPNFKLVRELVQLTLYPPEAPPASEPDPNEPAASTTMPHGGPTTTEPPVEVLTDESTC